MKSQKILSLLLSIVMILGTVSFPVFAEETIPEEQATPADDATVYLTVSNQGVLAADKDGNAMANREVTVKDIDEDGKLTYDETLAAAHKAYNSESGYVTSTYEGYTSVTKLWGIDTYNTLFFANSKGISGVAVDTVSDGDNLVASINKDNTYYADWYAFFDSAEKNVETGEEFILTLKGHLGMAYLEEDLTDVPLPNISIGTWEDGEFTQIGEKTTDDDGKVTLSFDKAGTYYVTANGTVKDEVTINWSTYETGEVDCPIIAPVCIVTVEQGESVPDIMSDEDAVAKIYEMFSVYTKDKLVFPLEYNGSIYTNVITYIKDRAKNETGRDVSVDYDTYIYTTKYTDWSSGSVVAVSYDGLDAEGNITQGYFTNNASKTMNYLKNITFTVGEETSETVSKLCLSITSLQRSPAEVVAFVKANLPFVRIANGNEDEEHIIKQLGEASGSSVALPNSCGLYGTTSATVAWSLQNVSGKSDALTLVASTRKITVSRPNVGEADAVFDLTATITSKADTTVSDTLTYRLTVPAFEGVVVPIQVTEGATLSLVDSYYGSTAVVEDKYIVKQEEAPEGYDLYNCTLHTNATGGSQSFKYTAEKDGYITKSGTISVTGEETETAIVNLIASSENDTRLATLESLAPKITIALESNKTEYSIDVSGVQSVKLTGTTAVEEATAKITSYYSSSAKANSGSLTTTGKALSSSGVVCYLPNEIGTSVIEITVTAPEGSTQNEKTRVYKITVNKKSESSPMTAMVLTASSSANGTNNNISAENPVPPEETLSPIFVAGGNESPYAYTVNYWRNQLTVKPTAKDCTITVNGESVANGKASSPISLSVGNNEIKISVTKDDKTTDYTVNVRRKAEFYITDVTLTEGELATVLATDGSDWTGSCNFDYNAETVHVTYHTNLSDEEEKNVNVDVVTSGGTYSGKAGQAIEIPVGTSDSVIPTVWVYYTTEDGVTEGQKYVISLKRKASDAPSAVESYLPAPGQFVNLTAWQEVQKTLNGSSGITLGAFGGNVVYRYDDPIKNDPNNPYGIDFIIYGNCFTDSDNGTSSGAAEPASVMVSSDGEKWYELAGSEYYATSAKHNISITYTNTDTTFTEAVETPWSTDDGSSGTMPVNEYHKQAYFPNPEYYNLFQKGIGKNDTYTAETVSFAGTMIDVGFYPFGYADSHSENAELANSAVNPYLANHQYVYNGDGFDIAWAVDENGEPVELSEISYIKIYNPVLNYGGSTGEKSAEIRMILRANAESEAVGVSKDLSSLNVNGTDVELEENVYEYTIDADSAATLKITPVTENAAANIYVSNKYTKSGDTASVTAVEKLRIIVQEDKCEPAIYIINFTNVTDTESNADLSSLSLTPGDIFVTPDEDNNISFTVANSVSSVRFTPETANPNASIMLTGGNLDGAVSLTNAEKSEALKLSVGANTFILTVKSLNGENEKEYTVVVTRKSGSGTGNSGTSNTIRVRFSLTGDKLHYDKENDEYTGRHTNPTWISSKTVTVPKGATVKYVTEMMLNNAGIDYTTDGIYISEIDGLAEFDNGPNSGWMYRHNDYIASEGYAARTLSDGDVVKWFYTDDYTKETGYEDDWDSVNSSASGTKTYTIRFETNGGSKVSSQKIEKNDIATEPEAPTKDGYTFDGWYTDKDLTKEYDFGSKVTKNITLYAKWAEVKQAHTEEDKPIENKKDDAEIEVSFTDVEKGAWYEEAVVYAVKNNLFKGISDTEFAPNANMTRAMLVTVLYRLENPEKAERTHSFTDVTDGEWYADAVAWAAECEVVNGISETEFAPNDNITREQMATIIYRYAKYKGYDVNNYASLSQFTDIDKISGFATVAISWANKTGLIEGTSDTTLSPQDSATRAQVAAILMRFCENIAK